MLLESFQLQFKLMNAPFWTELFVWKSYFRLQMTTLNWNHKHKLNFDPEMSDNLWSFQGWTIDSIFSLVKTLLLDWADVGNNSRIDKYSTSFHLLNGVWHDYHWFRLHGK